MTSTAERILELKRQVEVMEAYERGEEIEWAVRNSRGLQWQTARDPLGFDWPVFDYRVKPKKREVWLMSPSEYVHPPVCSNCIECRKREWQVVPFGYEGATRFVEAD